MLEQSLPVCHWYQPENKNENAVNLQERNLKVRFRETCHTTLIAKLFQGNNDRCRSSIYKKLYLNYSKQQYRGEKSEAGCLRFYFHCH